MKATSADSELAVGAGQHIQLIEKQRNIYVLISIPREM